MQIHGGVQVTCSKTCRGTQLAVCMDCPPLNKDISDIPTVLYFSVCLNPMNLSDLEWPQHSNNICIREIPEREESEQEIKNI